jgi:hypothetical protein
LISLTSIVESRIFFGLLLGFEGCGEVGNCERFEFSRRE